MAGFCFLDKSEFSNWAPALFRMMSDNMASIAPSGMPYDEEYRLWNEAVGEGLKAKARQIILVKESDSDHLIGFLQYYTNDTAFVIEELQIAPDYQGTLNFLHKLYRFVLTNIPSDLEYIEAFSHKSNARSISLQKKLGMKIVGTAQNDTLYHFRGSFSDFVNWYTRRKRR